MITKKLQNLSDKIVGSHINAQEIDKHIDYIEKNYEGGGSGGGVFMVEMGPYRDGPDSELKATWQEICDAFVSGKQVIAYASMTDPSGSGSFTHSRDVVNAVSYMPDQSSPYSVLAGFRTFYCETPDERPNTAIN